jgi:hypothetical protein
MVKFKEDEMDSCRKDEKCMKKSAGKLKRKNHLKDQTIAGRDY